MKAITLTSLILTLATTVANASTLIYSPTNPAFGGAAVNGGWLLNNANAQNQFKDPDSIDDKTPIEEFNDRLQRALLGRMTSVISRSVIGVDGKINPGTFETTDYIIDVIDMGDGQMSITTTDKLTGDTTNIVIDSGL